ncbi:MAG TPA: ABC transporter ATP-binding protein/permease [Firmicutes bacterium]|nr:ABC transporter ATP-binding protein/permease [Bacillota bacterium]
MARNKFDVDENLETPFNIQHLKRSFVYIKKHLKLLILALVASIIGSLASLCGPLLTQDALNNAVPQKDIPHLIWCGVLLTVTIVISIVMVWVRSRIATKVGQEIVFDMRTDLFAHLQELPFSYYDDRPHGKILVRVVQYINNVSNMLSNGLLNFIMEFINLIFIAIFMLIANVKLGLVILAGLPVLLLIVWLIMPAERRAWQRFSNKNSNMNAYIHESINGAKVTQAFAREKENAGIFHKLLEACRTTFLKGVVCSNWVWFSVDNISQIVTAFVYVAGVFWIQPIVEFGTLIAMGNYASRFWQPILNIADIYNEMINTLAYLERIFETMDEPVKIKDAEDAYELPPIKGEVEFQDVVFEYEPGHPILKGMNFKVRPGESVALVGPTGAGKTTVINLISRFYDIASGHVLIDGHEVNRVTLHSLRSQMGIMMQDSFIFSGDIRENIRYGKLDATQEEIERAAKTVRADEFIHSMERGYDTPVNERGSRLSQGQKQLISFARTLISDPKILILDEATSSIDTKTERLMQEGINQMLKGRTSFIIAHRLSTIKNCDRIMYIDDGRIVESGSHEELMERKGEYYKLYTAQLQEMSLPA